MKCLKCNGFDVACKNWLMKRGLMLCPHCEEPSPIIIIYTDDSGLSQKDTFLRLKSAIKYCESKLGETPVLDSGCATSSTDSGKITSNIRLRHIFPNGNILEHTEYENVKLSEEVEEAIYNSVLSTA